MCTVEDPIYSDIVFCVIVGGHRVYAACQHTELKRSHCRRYNQDHLKDYLKIDPYILRRLFYYKLLTKNRIKLIIYKNFKIVLCIGQMYSYLNCFFFIGQFIYIFNLIFRTLIIKMINLSGFGYI